MFDGIIQLIAEVEENQRMALSQLQIDHMIVSFVNCAEYLQNKLHF